MTPLTRICAFFGTYSVAALSWPGFACLSAVTSVHATTTRVDTSSAPVTRAMLLGMDQNLTLTVATMRVSGGTIPWSCSADSVARSYRFTSGSGPRYFVQMWSSRAASVTDAFEATPHRRRGGNVYVAETSRSFVNDASSKNRSTVFAAAALLTDSARRTGENSSG